MKTSEFLITLANWLENNDNPALILSENNIEELAVAAAALVEAGMILKNASKDLEQLEVEKEKNIITAQIEELSLLAEALYEDGDSELVKQAEMIDDLLFTFAKADISDKEYSEARLEELRKKYEETKNIQNKVNKVSENTKKIEQSPYYKEYRLHEAPLKTRYCPDHAGVSLARVADETYQCPLDHRTYDFSKGYEKLNGEKVPGGDVSYQTKTYTQIGTSVFDNRNNIMQGGYNSDRS